MTTVGDHRDRDEILAGIELADLLTELAYSRGLEPRGKQFPCPSLDHEQTGRTPPATVGTAAGGYGIWRCHACGAGGTAVDALIVAGVARDVAEAFAQLRGDPPLATPTAAKPAPARDNATEPKRPTPGRRSEAEIATARRELDIYIDQCQGRLWSQAGADALAWLRRRGLTDEEIRAHRLGFDPGYHEVPRPRRQLPAPPAPAVTMPLLNDAGEVIYAQARTLGEDSDSPKYLNPHSDWIGPSPRVGTTVAAEGADRSVLVVCEGMFDAIVAARHFETRVIIGAGQPDGTVAERLTEAASGRPVVVCFDADASGQDGAQRLEAMVAERAGGGVASVAPPAEDVNQLLLDAPEEFDATFTALIATAVRRARPDRPPLLRSALGELDQAFLDPRAGSSHATGYPTLDAALAGGLRAGVYMLAAPPGLGKTAIATQAAFHIARGGQPVIYLATEQTVEQLVGRAVCSQAGLSVSHYWRRTADFRAAWKLARDRLPLDTLAIADDEPRSEDDQRGSVARLAAMLNETRAGGGPVPVVIVDYLQDLQPGLDQRFRDEREQLSVISRSLLRLARRHHVPLLIISSVARDKYDTERPTIAAFKGSGDIEYTLDAGLVLRLAAEDADHYERLRDGDEDQLPLELYLVKNRFGRAGGSTPLEWLLDAETGVLLTGEGRRHDNHPPALPGLGTCGDDDEAMPF